MSSFNWPNNRTFYCAKYYKTTSATTDATAPINFNQIVYDTNNLVTTGASWKLTAPVNGIAVVKAFLTAASGTNSTFTYLYKNNTAYAAMGFVPNVSVDSILNGGSISVNLNATDYIDIRCFTSTAVNGGADLNFGTTSWVAVEFFAN